MKRAILTMILGAALAPALIFAQAAASSPAPAARPSVQLDLKTAVSLAEKNNFSLKGSQVSASSKLTAAQTSFSLFYPSISLNGGFTAGVTNPTTPSAARNSLSAGLTAGITLNPTMLFNIKKAWNAYATGLATYDQAYATLVTNVKKFYFGLLLLAEQVNDTRQQADADKQRYDSGDFQYKNGFMSESNMLTLEYAWKSKVYSLQTLQNSYETSLRQLEDVCGIDPASDVTLTSGIPDISSFSFDISKYSIDHNLGLKLLVLSKEQAEITRDTAGTALLPTLTVGGKLSGGYSTDPIANSIFDPASWNWSNALGFSVNLSVPLDAYLPYSQTQNALMLQNAAVQQIDYSIADQRQTVLRQSDTLLLTLKQVQSQIDSLTVNVTLAQRNLSLTEQLYTSGKKSILDLKDAENSLSDAQVQLISAKNNYLSALLDLENLYSADLGL